MASAKRRLSNSNRGSFFGRRTQMFLLAAALVWAANLGGPLYAQTCSCPWQTSGNTIYVPAPASVGIGTASPGQALIRR